MYENNALNNNKEQKGKKKSIRPFGGEIIDETIQKFNTDTLESTEKKKNSKSDENI